MIEESPVDFASKPSLIAEVKVEETQMVLSAANYLDDEAVIKHLPWMTPEEAEELLKRRAAEEIDRTLLREPEVTEDGEEA